LEGLVTQVGGESALLEAVTTASATNSAAAFAPASYAQRQPVAGTSTFSQEFEGYTSAQSRTPSRATSTTAKATKGNNAAQAAVTTPVTAAVPLILPASLLRDGAAEGDDTPNTADPADSSSLPATDAVQQPESIQTEPTAAARPPSVFMLRMQSGSADNENTPQQALSDDAGAGTDSKKFGDTPGEDGTASVTQTQNVLAALTASRPVDTGTAVKQTPAVSGSPELAVLRAQEQPPAHQPLNNILMQVNPSGNEKVLVRLVQQPGELRLAVHTDDPELAHSLQQGLSDLTGKLQENGYRTDAWQPVQTLASTPTTNSHNASNDSRQGDSQSQSGSQQGGDQQRQNQSNRPRWVQELESNLTSTGKASGESYGFSS